MSDGGKGDTPRPLSVSMGVFDANFEANFEAIFGKKTKLPQPEMKEVKPNDDIPSKCGDEND